MGKGVEFSVPRKGKYIVGYFIPGENNGLRVGHLEYTENIEELLERVGYQKTFAIIVIPKHD